MKHRLDNLLVELELAETRNKAHALIMAGTVLVNGKVTEKAGTMIDVGAIVTLKDGGSTFVGRGGDKIAPMFEHFGVTVSNRTAIDVGASTGGFTECLLRLGANLVFAVDSGKNQLHDRLRRDARVVVREKTNARYLQPEDFTPRPDLAVVDVSFISVRKILPSLWPILCSDFDALVLVKPQFELEKAFVEKGGVVRSREHQELAVHLVSQEVFAPNIVFCGSQPSPLTGSKKGNQEYFLHFKGHA